MLGTLTGGDGVFRGGYARTNDYAFINIDLNIASAFPFMGNGQTPPLQAGPLRLINTVQPNFANPNLITRTIVSDDFRSPSPTSSASKFSGNWRRTCAWRVGYVGTPGGTLFQTLDGNPGCRYSAHACRSGRGVIRLRANTATSDYNSLQTTPRSALPQRLQRRRPLHVEQVHRHGFGDLQPSQRRSHRRRARFVRPRGRQRTVGLRSDAPFRRQCGLRAAVLPGAGRVCRQDPRWLAGVDAILPAERGSRSRFSTESTRPGRCRASTAWWGTRFAQTSTPTRTVEDDDCGDPGGRRGHVCSGRSAAIPSPTCPGERVGNVGRDTVRADGIGNIDLSFIKNTRFSAGQNLQIRIEMFNMTNTRNFGIPESRINSTNFLNQWGTDGGAAASGWPLATRSDPLASASARSRHGAGRSASLHASRGVFVGQAPITDHR